jgi:diadenosine tetraphosphate (Ap4A) HIT family hydrolase
MSCVFCAVITALGTTDRCPHPATGETVWKVADLPASVAVLGADQFYRGYTVVIARTHATELFELPEPATTQYYHDMVGMARALAAAFAPRKLNYECLGNTVPHLHWHVFPRYADDPNPLRPVWEHVHPPKPPTAEEAEATVAAIRGQLGH